MFSEYQLVRIIKKRLNIKRKILDEVKNSISLSAKDNLDIDKVVFNYNEKEICKTVIKSIE